MANQDQNYAHPRRHRLEKCSSPPDMNILKMQLTKASNLPGQLIELPWSVSDSKVSFVLTVIRDRKEEMPVWTLYQGEGSDSALVWTSTDLDVELVADIMQMFAARTKSAFNVPDEVQTVEEGKTGTGFFENLSPLDLSLLKQKANVLLGRLLVEAELLPEPILESALKIQENVRLGNLSPYQAIEMLRREHAFNHKDNNSYSKANNAKDVQPIIDLLKQAGLVSVDDIETVRGVIRKHGGEIDNILVVSGKVDSNTMNIAGECWTLVSSGKLKMEQAIIALNYCNRSRVGFNEAIKELGWELS